MQKGKKNISESKNLGFSFLGLGFQDGKGLTCVHRRKISALRQHNTLIPLGIQTNPTKPAELVLRHLQHGGHVVVDAVSVRYSITQTLVNSLVLVQDNYFLLTNTRWMPLPQFWNYGPKSVDVSLLLQTYGAPPPPLSSCQEKNPCDWTTRDRQILPQCAQTALFPHHSCHILYFISVSFQACA